MLSFHDTYFETEGREIIILEKKQELITSFKLFNETKSRVQLG